MTDPYKALGLTKTATADEIKKAYRKIARANHPDLKPGDAEAEERFKAANAAYELLKDPEQRKRFDAGEIDATGQETAQHHRYYRDYAEAAGNPYRRGGAQYEHDFGQAGFDASDLFEDLFGRAQRQQQGQQGQSFSARGGDYQFTLTIDFLLAVNGGRSEIRLPDGQALAVTIPAGARDGQTLRLKGKGRPGIGQGSAGDILLTLNVTTHPKFRREGDDIHSDVMVPFDVAVLGGSVPVETVSGTVRAKVPPWTSSGKTLRLKGKGAGGKGSHLAHLLISLPDQPDDALKEMVEAWRNKVGAM